MFFFERNGRLRNIGVNYNPLRIKLSQDASNLPTCNFGIKFSIHPRTYRHLSSSGQDAHHSLQLPVVTILFLATDRRQPTNWHSVPNRRTCASVLRSNPGTVAVYNTKIGLFITTRLLAVARARSTAEQMNNWDSHRAEIDFSQNPLMAVVDNEISPARRAQGCC